jgi:hypothetical protein
VGSGQPGVKMAGGMKDAYWINQYGKILEIGGSTHIDQVIANPKKFGLTKEYIKRVYDKHVEKLGREANAREEIIFKLVNSGFIRIRLYPNKFWGVNVNRMDSRTKKALSKWAEIARENKFAGKKMDVMIDTKNGTIRDYTVDDLYYEKHLNESDICEKWFKPEFVKSISEFSELDIKYVIRL